MDCHDVLTLSKPFGLMTAILQILGIGGLAWAARMIPSEIRARVGALKLLLLMVPALRWKSGLLTTEIPILAKARRRFQGMSMLLLLCFVARLCFARLVRACLEG
jgi:hypothetical protein